MAIIPNAQKFHTVSSTVDTTDRGSSELQSQREIYTMQDIKDSAGPGYKVYTALLTQAGTAAPVATILKNNTGATFTWARTGGGTYTITASSNVFTSNKTLVFYNLGEYTFSVGQSWVRTSDTVITISPSGDGRITNGSFEILIYD
jgi:hypothetical protein